MVDTSDIDNEQNVFKFIDFGLCEQYIVRGKHVNPKNKNKIKGTKIYMSRNAHRGVGLSRRDDWESLCYLIYSLVDHLPWEQQLDNQKMLEQKEQFLKN